MSNTYHLFLSHSWMYSDAYEKLTSLLNNRLYFSYKNYSIPKNNPVHNATNDKLLYEAIKKQIAPSNVILILAGVYATYSKWINKEIQIANEEFMFKKPIIAIEPWGSERTSKIVKDNASRIVKWNTESIISAIRELC